MHQEHEYLIVGSGVAGSSVAKRLLEHKRATSILILEAGPEVESRNRRYWWDYVVGSNGREVKAYDFTTDQKGESTSSGNTDFLVEGSRVMLYGGSTVHWGGWCFRYKPEDFRLFTNTKEKLGEGVGGDWPFPYEDLVPYYELAEEHLSVCGDVDEPWNQDRRDFPYPRPPFWWTEADGEMIQAWEKNGIVPGKLPVARYRKCLTTGTCKYCPFGSRFSGQLILDELREDRRNINFEIRTSSPATNILLDSKSRITGVEYLDATTGETTRAYGEKVLLCNGAYEAPKLLMLSGHDHWGDKGLGAGNDNLGRYLVSHSMLKVRGVLDRNEECWFQEYDFPTLMSRTYDSEEWQHKNKILLFKNRALPNIDFAGLMIEGKTRGEIDEIWKSSREQELQAFMEEWGRYGNRVELAKGKNRFGLPKMKCHFDRTPSAGENGQMWLKKMVKVVEDMGYELSKERPPQIQDPGGHHATGTCRMAENAELGVTDRDMRVFGTDNLYVCSNAAFPTGSAVNPTLTLTAMAFRLADHLVGGEIKRGV